jgi:hypothetical protein
MAFSKREDLPSRITTAVAWVDRDMLTRVWNEMDYRKMSAVLPKLYILSSCEICIKNLGEFLCLLA